MTAHDVFVSYVEDGEEDEESVDDERHNVGEGREGERHGGVDNEDESLNERMGSTTTERSRSDLGSEEISGLPAAKARLSAFFAYYFGR